MGVSNAHAPVPERVDALVDEVVVKQAHDVACVACGIRKAVWHQRAYVVGRSLAGVCDTETLVEEARVGRGEYEVAVFLGGESTLGCSVELIELETELRKALGADEVVCTRAVESKCKCVDEGADALKELAVHM